MTKMLRLIQNEFIKSFKKISTIILFIIVVVVGIGFTALMYFAIEEEKSWNIEMGMYESIDYDVMISDCEHDKFPGYELSIEMWEYMRDNNIHSMGWKYEAVFEAFAYDIESIFDDEGNIVEEKAVYTYDDATRKLMLGVVEANDWKAFCEYMIKRNKAMGMPEETNWQWQYRIDNNIPLPETSEEYRDYKNLLISEVAMAKEMLASGATKEEQEDFENYIQLSLYRLDNDIKVNVADYSTGDWPDYTIWICLVNSAMIVSFIGLLVVVLAGSSVANEFSQGTIKFLLINPVKRWKILVSKYITCIVTGYAFILVFYFAIILLSMIFFGTADIGADYIRIANGEIVTTSGLFYIFKTYMIKSIDVIVMATLAFAISSLVRSSGLAIGVSVFSLLGGSTVVQLLATFKQDWARYLIWSNTDLTAISAGNSMFPNHSLSFAITVIVVHMVVFGLIAWDGFTKREI